MAATSDTPPTCSILKSTGSEAMARWQNDLQTFNHRVIQHRQANPWYVPTLSKWVDPEVWKRISEDLLNEEDRTNGGPPNDLAVEEYLRREGKYAQRPGEPGKVIHASALRQFKAIKWVNKGTHIASYEQYTTGWSLSLIHI